MRVRLSDERRATLAKLLRQHYEEHFDEELSAFRAEGLIDFFVKELGPPVYNQGVRDACAYLQGKAHRRRGRGYEPESLPRC